MNLDLFSRFPRELIEHPEFETVRQILNSHPIRSWKDYYDGREADGDYRMEGTAKNLEKARVALWIHLNGTIFVPARWEDAELLVQILTKVLAPGARKMMFHQMQAAQAAFAEYKVDGNLFNLMVGYDCQGEATIEFGG